MSPEILNNINNQKNTSEYIDEKKSNIYIFGIIFLRIINLLDDDIFLF